MPDDTSSQMPNCMSFFSYATRFNPTVGATGVAGKGDGGKGDGGDDVAALCRILCAPGSYNTATGCIA